MTNPYIEAGNKGHAYIWEQRWEDAARAFEAAIEGLPNDATLFDGLATAYREMEDYSRALDNYQKAAQLSNGGIIYLEQVGEMQQKLGLYPQAAKTFFSIGELKLRAKRQDEAVDKWLLAARLDPDLQKAHERLAIVYTKQNRTVQAVNEFLEVARLEESKGNTSRALEAVQRAARIDSRNADVLTALELLQSGKRAFDASQKSSPSVSFTPTSRMVEAIERQKQQNVRPIEDALRISREKMAEEIFETSASPNAMERMTLLSQALDFQTRGMPNEAIDSYEKAMSAGVDTPAARFNLGLLYQEKLRFDDAIEQLEHVSQMPEYRLAANFAMGESYRALGIIEKAIGHFINVLKIVDLPTVQHGQADRLIELYESLADSLMAKGERDKATEFSSSLVEFLSHKGWEDKVKEARTRLNALSAGQGTMILGDIITAGSPRVLESLYLAQEHTKRKLYNSALEEIYRAIELSPTYLPAHMQMGELLYKLQRTEAAVKKFMMIGNVCSIRGDVDGLIQAYMRAVDITPLDLEMRNKLLALLRENDRYDDTIDQYMKLANSYYQIAQIDKARQTYIEALKLAPRGSADRNWRAKILRSIGDIDLQRFDWRQALPVYRELRKVAPQDERVAMTLVDLNFRAGDRDQALQELDRYLVQLAKAGKGGKLIGILEDLARQRPTDAGIYDRLTRIYVQQKRPDKAIELLDQLGEAQLNAGQRQAALQTIKKILSLKPPNASDYQRLVEQLQG